MACSVRDMDSKMLQAIRAIELDIVQSDYGSAFEKKKISTYETCNIVHKVLQQTRLLGVSQGPWPLARSFRCAHHLGCWRNNTTSRLYLVV